jgi:hypothetical protein
VGRYLALLVVFAGCDLERTAVRITAPIAKRGTRALESESDIEFARAAAAGAIKTAEGLLETEPQNRDALELTANGYVEYAFGFLEDDLESTDDPERQKAAAARATNMYDRALGFALRYLATFDAGFPEAFRAGGAALDRALDALPREAAPGLTYAGVALASGINLNRGDPSRLVDLPKAVRLLERARQLDHTFGAGLAPMVLGLIYAQQPALGGEPARARELFEESIAVTGGAYLMNRVSYAHAYGRAVGDRNLLETTLTQVLAEPVERLPRQYRLANELARRRAARYLGEPPHAGGERIPRQRGELP